MKLKANNRQVNERNECVSDVNKRKNTIKQNKVQKNKKKTTVKRKINKKNINRSL